MQNRFGRDHIILVKDKPGLLWQPGSQNASHFIRTRRYFRFISSKAN